MMQNYYQENSAIQYAGLKPEEIYAKIQSDTETKIRAYVEKFKQDLEQLELAASGKQKKTFLGYVSIPFSLLYSGVKGYFTSGLDALNGIVIALANMVNDIAWIFKDPKTGTGIFFMLCRILSLQSVRVLQTHSLAGWLMLVVLGIDPKWAYGEPGNNTNCYSWNRYRASIMNPDYWITLSPDDAARRVVDEHTLKKQNKLFADR